MTELGFLTQTVEFQSDFSFYVVWSHITETYLLDWAPRSLLVNVVILAGALELEAVLIVDC